ncbi:MAG: hypothetical protein K0U98_25685 [Deltaproteobacteria bacterium]|nr:hypothetical protein [Deltaproteobacteria bacterium]
MVPLLQEAKKRASLSGSTLKAFVERVLRACLLPRPEAEEAFEPNLPVTDRSAPPAVEVADRRVLYDFMSEHS